MGWAFPSVRVRFVVGGCCGRCGLCLGQEYIFHKKIIHDLGVDLCPKVRQGSGFWFVGMCVHLIYL